MSLCLSVHVYVNLGRQTFGVPTDFETENESVDTAVVVRYDVIVVTPNAWLFRSD